MTAVIKIRESLSVIFAGLAIAIGASALGLALLVTIPIVTIAAVLYPSKTPLVERVYFWVEQWIEGFRLP